MECQVEEKASIYILLFEFNGGVKTSDVFRIICAF